MRIRVGHSPDPDDAFMVWGLVEGAVDAGGLDLEWYARDIETLNRWALQGRLEVTAISLHTYPFVRDRYVLLPHGASMGAGYGPVVVAERPLSVAELREAEIVVPGTLTTAFLVLRMAIGDFPHRELPFDRILAEVAAGRAAAGLLIHEAQLAYEDAGLAKCLDLGEWWLLETGLPLPLGVTVARRDLGDVLPAVSAVLRASIEAGLARREEAMTYALRFAHDVDPALAERFVSLYVNELTRDYGDEGRRAVEELLRRAAATGAVPGDVRVEFSR